MTGNEAVKRTWNEGLVLSEAQLISQGAVALLQPYCEKIEVVGSVRRGKPEGIHDIEVLCIPRFGPTEDSFEANQLDWRLRRGLPGFTEGEPSKDGRKAPFKERYYRLKFQGVKFDLFACLPPAQWGLLKLIRTGPADFSHEFVTRLWDYGLKSKDGHIEHSDGVIIKTPEEIDVFHLCQLDYIEPTQRTIDKLRRENILKANPP